MFVKMMVEAEPVPFSVAMLEYALALVTALDAAEALVPFEFTLDT
jgi:hypothetical protein